MTFMVNLGLEESGRWVAEVFEDPGVIQYGKTPEEALHAAMTLYAKILRESGRIPEKEE